MEAGRKSAHKRITAAKSASRVLTRRGLLMEDPKDTVGRSEMRAWRPSVLQHGKLLPKGEDLKLESSPVPKRRNNIMGLLQSVWVKFKF